MIQQLPAQERIIQADLQKKAPKKENKAFINRYIAAVNLVCFGQGGSSFSWRENSAASSTITGGNSTLEKETKL